MNNNNLIMLKGFFFLVILMITVSILTTIAQSTQIVDKRFEACKPKNCRYGPNISYPFWIQDDYCGYPEFRVQCRDNNPFIHTSGNDYFIKEISYDSQSFRVENSVVRNGDCPAPLQNSTFDDSSPFKIGSNYDYLYFFYNCSGIVPDYVNLTYPVPCVTSTENVSFAMFMLPQHLSYVETQSKMCNTVIREPVEGDGVLSPTDPGDYKLLMKNGFTLQWDKRPCNDDCQGSGGFCGVNDDRLVCFCVDGPHQNRCNDDDNMGNVPRKVGTGVASAVGAAILSVLLVWLLHIRHSRKNSSSDSSSIARFWKQEANKNGHQDVEAFIRDYGPLAAKRFKYTDVKKITNSFKEKLGQGGYGSVFKGKLHDGRLVAVKVLCSTSKSDGQEFINEVASISRTSHVNIVTLLGFCFDGNKRALIYEFMPNGSLDKFIYGEKQESSVSGLMLGWETLYKVAVGIARGLEYLHRGCNTRILHFDIKPHNILLDEDFSPKIADFGLAKLCPGKESIISMLGTRGTAGYIAPEVFSRNFGGVSHKSDVYSFGMMVLEMVGGRKNIDLKVGMDHSSQLYFPHWIYDRIKLGKCLGLIGVITEEREEATRKMIIVGLWCIQTNPLSRPSMSKVLEMLEGSAAALHIPPKPFLSSPPASPPSAISSSTISISSSVTSNCS